MIKGALEGLRIVDLTRVLAGPFATMMLADMGAQVVKIEEPGKGDDSRFLGPFINGESIYYMNLNRNKKGITLNLKSSKGKELFLKLVGTSDIVVENFRPGTMEKLGLGYEDLKKIHPKIIYAAVSGFGHYGPYKDRPGYDIIGQAMGGLMSTTGWPGQPPTRTGTAMGDVLGGLSVAIGMLSAIRYRDQHGVGQKIDVSLVDSVVASMEIITQIYLVDGRVPERIGNRYEAVYPYDSFEAKDGYCVIGAGNNKLYAVLCKTIGLDVFIDDERFLTVKDRVKNHAVLKPLIEAWTKERQVNSVVDTLLEAGVPAAPIYDVKQVVEDPHIAGAREMFVEIDHPLVGRTKLTGCHIKMSETKPSVKTPAPTLGQHNEEIFGGLGLSEDEVRKMRDEGVI
ncbi:MAG: CoA transferase [Deltaproteobacteria bacterium]|nr:CoA transferase [Deltaproteobacteria bacterium]MCX5855909.1 CoA transferase [Deltaproteobacteria bacterium]